MNLTTRLARLFAVLLGLSASLVGGSGSVLAAGTPIEAPLETWTWVDFPDAKCAYGSSTGLGINLTNKSDRLVIFFEGGGACWDFESCYVNVSASNLDGYSGKDFVAGRPYDRVPLFNRTDARNPLPDANYVYVPYCTGDVFTGDNVMPLGPPNRARTTYFVGYRNLLAYLDRLVPTLPDVNHVWVAGWSAGGFGAGMSWVPVADAFPGARVDVIDDSGPPFMPNGDRWEEWLDAWQWPAPQDCPECVIDISYLVQYYADRFDGEANFALLSYTKDPVISSYFGMTRQQFNRELYAMADNQFTSLETMKYFFVEGSSHVMLSWNTVGPGGIPLSDWLTQMVNDDPAWNNVRP